MLGAMLSAEEARKLSKGSLEYQLEKLKEEVAMRIEEAIEKGLTSTSLTVSGELSRSLERYLNEYGYRTSIQIVDWSASPRIEGKVVVLVSW